MDIRSFRQELDNKRNGGIFMAITVSQLKSVQLSPEEEAEQRTAFSEEMKEILAHSIQFSVQSALKDLMLSVKTDWSEYLKASFAQLAKTRFAEVLENNERRTPRYQPGLSFQRPPEIRVTYSSPQVIIIVVDGK